MSVTKMFFWVLTAIFLSGVVSDFAYAVTGTSNATMTLPSDGSQYTLDASSQFDAFTIGSNSFTFSLAAGSLVQLSSSDKRLLNNSLNIPTTCGATASMLVISSAASQTVTITPGAVCSSSGATWYVTPNGSDANAGTLAAPFRTITKAHQAASAGDTINVRAGTYREGITVTKSNLTIQSYPGETATIKGSDVVTGWMKDPAKNMWTRTGPRPMGGVDPIMIQIYRVCSDDENLCRFPYQVFIDNQPLTIVSTSTTPGPGQFSYDNSTNIWRIGTDPTGKTAEVSIRNQWIAGNGLAEKVTVRGMHFLHASTGRQNAPLQDGPPRLYVCDPSPGQTECTLAQIRALGQSWVFENNDIGFAHGSGVSIEGSYAIVRNNRMHDNAAMGLRGSSGPGVLIEGNTISRNTVAPYNLGYSGGGVKVVIADQWTFRNNMVYDNYGPGLWCDIGCKGVIYDGNRVYNTRGKSGHGIEYELSTDGIFKNNIVYDNGASGIYISNSATNKVENNVLARNKYGDILLDNRNRQVQGQPPPPPTWNTYGNIIQNNTFINNDPSSGAYALITAIDYNNYGIFTKNTADRNSVYNTGPTWYSWDGAYGSPGAFCASPYKQECNSTVLTAAQVQQVLTANGIPLTAILSSFGDAPSRAPSPTKQATDRARTDAPLVASDTASRAQSPATRSATSSLTQTTSFTLPVKASTPALAPVNIVTVDTNASPYGTFQSHNQKVVANKYGIFMTYLHDVGNTKRSWRLARSTDNGGTFVTVYEQQGSAVGTPIITLPAIDTDSNGSIYAAGGGDADGGDAYFWRFDPATNFAAPAINTVIPQGGAQKFTMLMDENRSQVYYIASTLSQNQLMGIERFYAISPSDGAIKNTYVLTKEGISGDAHYPLLYLDKRDGYLYAAWTTIQPGEYDYWSIHVIRSKDGGNTWQKLDGTALSVPIVADESGPTDRVTLDDEFQPSTWLANFIVKDGKIHFMYRAKGDYPTPGAQTHRLAAIISAYAEVPGYPAAQANDNDLNTQWVASLTPDVANNNAWVQLDFGTQRIVERLRWKGADGTPYPAHSPADYSIEISNDGNTWVPLIQRTSDSGVIDGNEFINRLTRYVRIVTTKVNDGSGLSLSFHEFLAEGIDQLSSMDREHYMRYDIATARKDVDIYPEWKGNMISLLNLDGFCTTRALQSNIPIYCISRSTDNRIAVLVSYDSGSTWHDYAKSNIISNPNGIYAIGGAREITSKGDIIGSYTEYGSGGTTAVKFFKVSGSSSPIPPPPPSAPSITSLTPAQGPKGTEVVIRGENFTPKNNVVQFGKGFIKNLKSQKNTRIVFTVPGFLNPCPPDVEACIQSVLATTPGAYDVVVINAQGRSAPRAFTVGARSSITITEQATDRPRTDAPLKQSDTASFAIGSRIRVVENVRVHYVPNGDQLGIQPVGAQGVIIDGPVLKSDYRWWKVNYDTGVDGWSAQPWLKVAQATDARDKSGLLPTPPPLSLLGAAAAPFALTPTPAPIPVPTSSPSPTTSPISVFVSPPSIPGISSKPFRICPQFTRTLIRGMWDDTGMNGEIAQLQRFLAADTSTYPEGLVTGYFGALTERAVQRWQNANGIVSSGSPADTGYGVIGPRTRKAMQCAALSQLTFIPETLPSAHAGIPYAAEIYAKGIDASNLATEWTISKDALPPGLTLLNIVCVAYPCENTTITISGTPTAKGSYKFTVRFVARSPDPNSKSLESPEFGTEREYTVAVN